MSIQRVSSKIPSADAAWKHDVFLSFRGEDTRRSFTDHLYTALIQKGITVFRDDQEYLRGKFLAPAILQSIEESRFAIVVFSKNYASSTWCLDELVKIVECSKTRGQLVIPVYYDVDPAEVRKQTGYFCEAFVKYDKIFKDNINKVQTWRGALTEVANLSGWDLGDRHESKFIQDIVKDIISKLRFSASIILKDLVGIDSRLEKLKMLIDAGSDDVRMIGIWGMGGIGKTTIARVTYDLISCEFEGSCFLANVAEVSEKNGLVSLQEQLLSQILMGIDIKIYNVYNGISFMRNRLRHKRVLVVLDDVVHADQLNILAGKHDWFGPGSRIIITTRDKYLLTTHGVNDVYKVELLNDDEALHLFSLKAFKNHPASEDYLRVTKSVIKYAGGLPLALHVLGNYLFGRTVDEWESVLQKINRHSVKEILDNLKKSFDVLEQIEKEVFLNIACFFNGKDISYVTNVLERCGFNATIGVSVLIDKSLITILPDNKLWMHDLLQEMGQQIVKRESPQEFERRRRLFEEADVLHTKSMGCRLFSVFFLVLEAISVALDQYGKSKRGFLLAAFLLSAFGFLITMYACIKKRTTAAFRLQAEKQLVWVEVVFSVIQLVTTLVQFILSVMRVKKYYSASLLPLAFAIVVAVFTFKKEKVVITHAQFSNMKLRTV